MRWRTRLAMQTVRPRTLATATAWAWALAWGPTPRRPATPAAWRQAVVQLRPARMTAAAREQVRASAAWGLTGAPRAAMSAAWRPVAARPRQARAATTVADRDRDRDRDRAPAAAPAAASRKAEAMKARRRQGSATGDLEISFRGGRLSVRFTRPPEDVVAFDRRAYQRDYMRKWRKKRGNKVSV